MHFRDRHEAGLRLAEALGHYGRRQDQPAVIVLGLPRGGVPVAAPVARVLSAPLDVFVVRKLGAPFDPEYAIGAIASGGVRVMNVDADLLGVSAADVEVIAAREHQELLRREQSYRDTRPPLRLAGQVVILVDDGLATGATMRTAVRAVRRLAPQRIVAAVPVGSIEACESVRQEADELVCLATPHPFRAVGLWYDDFDQTSDEEVRALLRPHDKAAGAR